MAVGRRCQGWCTSTRARRCLKASAPFNAAQTIEITIFSEICAEISYSSVRLGLYIDRDSCLTGGINAIDFSTPVVSLDCRLPDQAAYSGTEHSRPLGLSFPLVHIASELVEG
jgi:hypothetical protein